MGETCFQKLAKLGTDLIDVSKFWSKSIPAMNESISERIFL